MFASLGNVQKFLVASVFPIAALVIPLVTAADLTSVSGLITLAVGVLTALGVYVVPNKQPVA
jgi:hypothetical protein